MKKKLKIEKFKREKIRDILVRLAQVINIDCKVRNYKKYVEKISKDLEEKDIFVNSEEDKKVLSGEQIKYAFAYCIYYIGNKGKNQKVEKMRALYGMAQNLIGSGVMIIISGVFILLQWRPTVNEKVVICFIVAAIIFVVAGLARVIVYSKHMIRMTMGVYQACLENDESER